MNFNLCILTFVLILIFLSPALSECSAVIDSYDGSKDNSQTLDQVGRFAGQAFTIGGTERIICSSKFYYYVTGSGTMVLESRIYACSGAVGTTGIPTGSPLATSTNITYTSAQGVSWVEYTFPTPYTLSASTDYCISLYVVGEPVNGLETKIYFDISAPTHSGNAYTFFGAQAADCNFYMYYFALPTSWTDLGMNLVDHTPTVSWTNSVDAATTYVYVGTTSTPTTVEGSTTSETLSLGSTVTLSDGVTYYYRLRAYNTSTGIYSGYTTADQFRMNTPPTIPTLNSPVDQSSVSVGTTTLTTNSVVDAEGDTVYYLFYADNSTGSTLRQNTTGLTYNYNHGDDYGPYYWKVRTWDGYEYSTDYSSVWSFSVLIPPLLISPANNSNHSFDYPPLTKDITFTWEDLSATSYHISIAKDSDFYQIAIDSYPLTNTSTHSLEEDHYWWRVKVYDSISGNYSSYNETWEFNVTMTAPNLSTAVQGIVYDDSGDPLKDVLVTLWNNTFSDTYITGSNGYYMFDELDNSTYSIQATKYKYDDSIIYYVTLTSNETYVRNILMQEILGEYEWEHYVKFKVMSETGTLYTGVNVVVYYPSTEVIGDDSGVTGSDGSVTFVLDEKKYYKVTFTYTDPVFDKTIYLYPKEDFYIIVPIITTDVMLNGLEYSLYFDETDNIIFKQTDPNNEAIWTNMTVTNSTGYLTSYNSSNDTISWSYLMANGSDTYCVNVTFNTVTNGLMYIQKCTTPDGYPVPLKDLSDNTKNILSIFLLIVFALLFGHAYVKSGAVIVSLMACLLWYMDWLQVSGAILTLIILIAVMSKLGELRR